VPYILVPLTPEKKGALEELIGSDEGLLVLAHQYQAFLLRVTRHPVLAKSEELRLFLEESAEEYRERRKADEALKSSSNSTLQFFSSSAAPPPKDPQIQKLVSELQEFERILKAMLDYAQRLKTKYKEVSSDYEKFSKEIARLASNPSLKTPVSGYQIDNKFLSKLNRFAISVNTTAKLTTSLALSSETILYERIKEWLRYNKAALQLIDRYTETSDKYNTSVTELNKKKALLDQLLTRNRTGVSQSDTDKLHKFQTEVIAAQTEVERLRDISNKTQNEFWNEINSFDRYKMMEMSHWMDYFSQQQLKDLTLQTKTWSTFTTQKD
jgi:uncharacterized coiled-coil DUF342 family protein